MQRDPQSHKGENGKVAVIGGSEHIHGAPIFSALAAEATGADLIYVCLPKAHDVIARQASLNFMVHPFAGGALTKKDTTVILELLATMDSTVIGPGLARTPEALAVLRDLVASAPCAIVLDASALQPWTLEEVRGKPAVLTPHLGELERMGVAEDALAETAKEYGVTILLKGAEDRIASPDGSVQTVAGGNAGLTVGGTGDALAGCVAGLIAQKIPAPEACVMASTLIKRAGTVLSETRGFAYTTREVIAQIPPLLMRL